VLYICNRCPKHDYSFPATCIVYVISKLYTMRRNTGSELVGIFSFTQNL